MLCSHSFAPVACSSLLSVRKKYSSNYSKFSHMHVYGTPDACLPLHSATVALLTTLFVRDKKLCRSWHELGKGKGLNLESAEPTAAVVCCYIVLFCCVQSVPTIQVRRSTLHYLDCFPTQQFRVRVPDGVWRICSTGHCEQIWKQELGKHSAK